MLELPAPPISARLEDLRYAVNQDRNSSVVIDPYSFLPFNPRSRIPWQNRQPIGYLYRLCSDPATQTARERVHNWDTIRFCDYKLHTASLDLTEPFQLLELWLTNPEPRIRLLHISIDDSEAVPLQLLATLKGLRWSGLLGIQILDHCDCAVTDSHYASVRSLFDTNRLVGLDYIRQSYTQQYPSVKYDLLADLLSPTYF